MSKSDVLHGHFHNAGRTIPRIVICWFSSILESFMPLVGDGHTAWIHCFETSNQFHRRWRWFPNAYAKLDNRDCAAQRHPLTPSLFDTFSKNLSHTSCKQQSSNFTEMTSGLYVSIQSFRDVFTLSQITLVKLIFIANCREFYYFLACGNFANLRCQGYLYFDSREKYFIVSYGVLIR